VSTSTSHHGSELVLEAIGKAFGEARAVEGVSLTVEPSEFVTLLGPSGSGKTTILRMIGGFVAPDTGRILIDGSDVCDVPVERRPTAMLFQQLSLWPHLSVARNISFGLELRRRPKQEIDERVRELLEVVGLSDFGARLPSQLSGGQQQRVALARALALEPRILLLDEPFSALDTKLRIELRTFVRNLQREVGTTTLLVTHDQEEALGISDRIVVLRDGCVEQIGDPTEIYDAPRTSFVAEFLGAMNFLRGSLTREGVALESGTIVPVVERTDGTLGPAKIGVRPEDVIVLAVGAEGDEGAGGDAFSVEQITVKGHYKELSMRSGDQWLRAYVGKDLTTHEGDRFRLRFRRTHLFGEDPQEEVAGDSVPGAPSGDGRGATRVAGDQGLLPSGGMQLR